MTETQKSFPDAFKFAFGFGNVYVSMRYGEELPKEEVDNSWIYYKE